MPELNLTGLLRFARKLHGVDTLAELLALAREEAQASLGFQHVWFFVANDESAEELRLIQFAGSIEETVQQVAPVLKVKGDAFLEAVVASEEPVVIFDARLDPRTNKEIVAQLQNRTLINLPLRLVDRPLGIFGLGTFGDEGCRAINEAELGYLIGMASQLTVAISRVRLAEARLESEKEHRQLESRMFQMQRLESLGLLAGGIAHDFNNLLTVILASANLADDLTDAPEAKVEIAAIQAAASRGGDLTRQLLAMSRQQAMQFQPLDVNLKLREILQLARRVLPASIEIDLIQGHALPKVEGDPTQLDQVFMNLFINARDAMPNGGRLTVESERVLINGRYQSVHPWARPGRYILVTVTDTGTGMPAAIRERIFEPFFTTKGHRTGTGLGLAVAYGVIQQHRGMIHCYSEEGVGTTFKIYLPIFERSAEDVGTKLESAPLSGPESVLVAEDDELVRDMVKRVLSRAGYKVEAVATGDDACARYEQERFEVVLMDVVMPGSPCQEVVERLLRHDPTARIVLTSGYTASTNVAALVERTGFPLLRKPYDPDLMLRAIRSALDRGRVVAT